MSAKAKGAARGARSAKTVKPEIVTTYMLRTCNADMTSYGGFQWPTSGPVSAPDWKATPRCGHGLHGLLMGAGNASLMDWSEEAKWLVVAVDASEVVAIDEQKVKVPKGDVIYCGTREGAIALLIEKGADPSLIPCGQASASGQRGQASASGDYGQASASGYQGQASASGYQGQASASGETGRAMAGTLGIVMLTYWDTSALRTRIVLGYVGENGIEANTWYQLDEKHAFVVATHTHFDGFVATDCSAEAKALEATIAAAKVAA